MKIRNTVLFAAALGTVGALAIAAPAPASAPRTAAVHGAAQVLFPYAPEDDVIRFSVDAEAAPYTRPFTVEGKPQAGMPVDAKGKVTVHHERSDDGSVGTSEAEVDCLMTGDGVATLTAIVTKSNVGTVGNRIGISVQDGRHGAPDRLGFSWGTANLDPGRDPILARVGTCMAPAPFTTVTGGGFKVTSAPLPPLRG
ncbi:hypothetical protein ACFV7Q_02875 [Streptomyces sp. NPDC059851]|uniref:hypothetical protein n=1 Tax=Streptomyces sp. NPDC059851 TaxID=3346971 RepID=UPI00366834D9